MLKYNTIYNNNSAEYSFSGDNVIKTLGTIDIEN
jgi:hypothetical protein